jgi:hypothetical protein
LDSVTHDKQSKQTNIALRLRQAVPVSFVQPAVASTFDYHRPVTIQALVDSVKTQTGWHYSWQHVYSGTLSSLAQEPFTFENIVTSRIRITVQNADNAPLSFSGFTVKGNVHRLVARFDRPASYHLLYGNARSTKPSYDIGMFENNIPADVKEATLGPEETRAAAAKKQRAPLFENEIWLWLAMGLTIVLLGPFTLKMMRTR